MHEIAFSKQALRALTRMPVDTARLIRSKLDLYASDPTSLKNNVKALQGELGVLRLRVGDWRILFTDAGHVLSVIKIGPRGTVYGRR